MSWRASGYVKELEADSGLTMTEKFVLLMLADYHNPDRNACWPSISTLARQCLMSERNLSRILASLEKKQFVKRLVTPGKVNGYRLTALPTPDTRDIRQFGTTDRTPDAQVRVPLTPTVATPDTHGSAIRKEPYEPYSQNQTNAPAPADAFNLTSPDNQPEPPKTRKPAETMWGQIVESISQHYERVNHRKISWANKLAFKRLQREVANYPNWTIDQWEQCIVNRYKSLDYKPRSLGPEEFVGDLHRFAYSPLDRFGKEQTSNGNRRDEDTERTYNEAAEILRRTRVKDSEAVDDDVRGGGS